MADVEIDFCDDYIGVVEEFGEPYKSHIFLITPILFIPRLMSLATFYSPQKSCTDVNQTAISSPLKQKIPP